MTASSVPATNSARQGLDVALEAWGSHFLVLES